MLQPAHGFGAIVIYAASMAAAILIVLGGYSWAVYSLQWNVILYGSSLLLVGALWAWMLGTTNIIGSLVLIDVGHVGLLTQLGSRKDRVLEEGWNWLPPFCSCIVFDGREKQLEIPLNEVLSSDNVPIRIKGQFRTRVVDPMAYSGVVSPDALLLGQAQDAVRSHFASKPALEIAASGTMSGEVRGSLERSTKQMGVSISHMALSELRLPAELERIGQMLKIIREQHPEIPFRDLLDAMQNNKQQLNRLVVESPTLEAAATAFFGSLWARGGR